MKKLRKRKNFIYFINYTLFKIASSKLAFDVIKLNYA